MICKAVADVKTPDVGQVQGVLRNCELPVWPRAGYPGELGRNKVGSGGIRWRRPGLLW